MDFKVIIIAIVIQSCLLLCRAIDVQTPLGKIRGVIQKSRKGVSYYSFRGVRYAEPPTGENRFRVPIPVKPWNGVMDATKDGFICPQNSTIPLSLMSEDCLILNVYTKSLQNGLLPVMFYLHGGYFAVGGSHSDLFWNPRYLMDKDICVVTINFRLGVLGYISTGSKDAPGNLGLKDQVLALQWVRDNIRYFGGDPNQVTLWGHSSGSMMVSLHLVSPMSLGLYQKVAPMSGSATSQIIPSNQKTTKSLANRLKCYTNNPKLLVECLRVIPWEKFVETIPSTFDWYYEIEEYFGQKQFLSRHPSILLAQGKFPRVPIMVGITKDEMEPLAYTHYYKTSIVDELNKNFYKTAPMVFAYDPTLTSVTKTLRSFYFHNQPITKINLLSYGRLLSDALVGFGVHRFVQTVTKFTEVYFYRQDYQGRYSWVYDPKGKPYGVYHSDDLLYLFVYKEKAPMFAVTDPENVMVEIYTTLFTTFAQTGNPNNQIYSWTSNIRWKPANRNCAKILYINKKSHMGLEPYKNRMQVWDRLFPISAQRQMNESLDFELF